MKTVLIFSFTLFCLNSFSQTLQNIHKNTGTVSNPINQIDSIRFDTVTNQMEVVLQNGVQSHALSDVINVTITTASNACGADTSVTDIEGNVYQTIPIGNQCWMKENLKTSKYKNGAPIPTGLSNSQWQGATTGAYSIYNNSTANNDLYGKLYNFYTVADPRGLCPEGWHVPTHAEWTTLENFLGGITVAGGKMKTTTGWNPPNTGATNESGFSGLPGGFRYYNGNFNNMGNNGFWWTSTVNFTSGWYRSLDNTFANTYIDYNLKSNGMSVRCVKD
jgi:uncharacterized protein (TIGR02145 family)